MKKLFGVLMIIITLFLLPLDATGQYYNPYGVNITVTHKDGDKPMGFDGEAKSWLDYRDPNAAQASEQRAWASQEAEKQRQHELELARIAAGGNRVSSSTTSSSTTSSGSASGKAAKSNNVIRYYGIYHEVVDHQIVWKDSLRAGAVLDMTDWRFALVNLDNGAFANGHPFTLKYLSNEVDGTTNTFCMSVKEFAEMFLMIYDEKEQRYRMFGTWHESGEGWVFIPIGTIP